MKPLPMPPPNRDPVCCPVPRIGVVFDIDGTLADATGNSDAAYRDPTKALDLFESPPLEPTLQLAQMWEHRVGADVFYLTGRGLECWTPTRLWLNKYKLLGTLICRWDPEMDVSLWKSQEVNKLVRKHGWTTVHLFEDNKETIRLVEQVVDIPVMSNLVRQASTNITQQDLAKVRMLMSKFSDCPKGWEPLLKRAWTSRSALLDAAQEFVPGPKLKRQYRSMIDTLWRKQR